MVLFISRQEGTAGEEMLPNQIAKTDGFIFRQEGMVVATRHWGGVVGKGGDKVMNL